MMPPVSEFFFVPYISTVADGSLPFVPSGLRLAFVLLLFFCRCSGMHHVKAMARAWTLRAASGTLPPGVSPTNETHLRKHITGLARQVLAGNASLHVAAAAAASPVATHAAAPTGGYPGMPLQMGAHPG